MTLLPFIAAFVILSAGLYGFLVATDPRRARVTARLATITHANGMAPRDLVLERPFQKRVLAPVLKAASQAGTVLTPSGQRARMVAKLQQAGYYHAAAIHTVLAVKGAGVAGSLLGAWLVGAQLAPVGVLVGAFGLAVSLVAPEMFINRLVTERQIAISRALPDTLDLITASVEAGLTMDGAIARIAANPNPMQVALSDELNRYLQEIRLGRSRAEALGELGRRCGVSDLQSVVAALLQADSLGVGVGTVLRAQSQHLRTRRKQRAQEAAMKAPIKMLFPLVLFIFPSIFIVTLGPAVIKILDMFATQ